MNNQYNNGLHSFSFHESEDGNEIFKEINSSQKAALSTATGFVFTPEDAAKDHLHKAMEGDKGPLQFFNHPVVGLESKLDFVHFQTEQAPVTENILVKFRQRVNNISIYGSNICIELDKDYNLISINSTMLPEINVSAVAAVSPAEAIKKAEEYTGNKIPPSAMPQLYFYFFEENWLLVYIIKDVISKHESSLAPTDHRLCEGLHKHSHVNYVNIIIDAQSGRVLKESPRIISAAANGFNVEKFIHPQSEPLQLVNQQLNVYTYDVSFKQYDLPGNLPGQLISKQNDWLSAGEFAHYHACTVVAFLKDVLKRNGVDNKGMKLISSVQCVEKDGINEWQNAAWLPVHKQMVYGQVEIEGQPRSLATSLDIV
ncbi:MAG: hypothetical protein WCF67_03865, partial [Chitinophagaceae bacterium]